MIKYNVVRTTQSFGAPSEKQTGRIKWDISIRTQRANFESKDRSVGPYELFWTYLKMVLWTKCVSMKENLKVGSVRGNDNHQSRAHLSARGWTSAAIIPLVTIFAFLISVFICSPILKLFHLFHLSSKVWKAILLRDSAGYGDFRPPKFSYKLLHVLLLNCFCKNDMNKFKWKVMRTAKLWYLLSED